MCNRSKLTSNMWRMEREAKNRRFYDCNSSTKPRADESIKTAQAQWNFQHNEASISSNIYTADNINIIRSRYRSLIFFLPCDRGLSLLLLFALHLPHSQFVTICLCLPSQAIAIITKPQLNSSSLSNQSAQMKANWGHCRALLMFLFPSHFQSCQVNPISSSAEARVKRMSRRKRS